MKPSAAAVYAFMTRHGGWLTSTDIIRNVGTVTPSKRLDELHDLGLIEKRPHKGRQMEYRAKEVA